MTPERTRRHLLASLGTLALVLAGCLGTDNGPATGGEDPATDDPDGTPIPAPTESPGPTPTPSESPGPTPPPSESPGPTPLPEDPAVPAECPTSQNIDVPWPQELDATAAVSFVEEYEHAYYRDFVVEYEPESRLDSYGLDGHASAVPADVEDGYVVAFSGSGGVYRPTLHLGATVAEPPADTDVVSAGSFDDETLAQLFEQAAADGEAAVHIERSGSTDVDSYVDRFASRSSDFERLTEPGDNGTLYVDVDGTTVEVRVSADRFHGDYWWDVRYYVSERVVRRASDDATAPQDGELLECRNPD